MNILALCLVYASLVTAGLFTPNPEKHKDDVTVKGGVVIGFEKEDGNTKVSISPQDSHEVDEKGYVTKAKEKFDKAKERLKEASSSVLPEVVKRKGDSANQVEEEIHHKFRPGEVVCDEYGKCKEKIESYLGRTKEAAAEKKANEGVEEGKGVVKEAIGKARDTAAQTVHRASDKARETKESMKDAASEAATKAKEKVAEKASEMKQGAKERVKEKAKEAEEMARSASERAKHGAHKAKNEGKKGLKGVLRYMVSPVRMASLAGVMHLLGFASAYGMCVWVTFASNYVLAAALPRQQFAMAQSKLYPVYFKAMACSVGMALLGHTMDRRKRSFSPLGLGMFQRFDLVASFVMILVNLLYLEPRATKVMFERMKKEKEEGREEEGDATQPSGGVVDSATETAAGGGATTTEGEKREEAAPAAAKPQNTRSSASLLHRLNSYLSLLNVATLMSLTWHLVQLGQHLHAVC